MFVSIVIATRNRSALLSQTLDVLAEQRWPVDQLEIVVADNGSSDDTRAVVGRAARRDGGVTVRYLYVPQPGKSHAVNAALQIAQGDLVAFTDDDVRPDRDWIAALARAVEDASVDFVAGRIQPIWEIDPPRWMSPALYGVLAIPDNGAARVRIPADGPAHEMPAVMPIGANMAVRASVISRIGGLRTDLGKLAGSLRTGEDHEFFLRLLQAGCRGVYEPAAVVHHFVPRERLRRDYFRKWLHQNGRDVAKLERDYTGQARRLFAVPRYLWRQAAADAVGTARAALTGDERGRFAAWLRLVWFAGYLRDSWPAAAGATYHALRFAGGR